MQDAAAAAASEDPGPHDLEVMPALRAELKLQLSLYAAQEMMQSTSVM